MYDNTILKKPCCLNLDKLLEDFSQIEKKFAEINGKNNLLEIQLEKWSRMWKISQTKQLSFRQEYTALQGVIKGLQETIELQCNMRDENGNLKKKISTLEGKLQDVTEVPVETIGSPDERADTWAEILVYIWELRIIVEDLSLSNKMLKHVQCRMPERVVVASHSIAADPGESSSPHNEVLGQSPGLCHTLRKPVLHKTMFLSSGSEEKNCQTGDTHAGVEAAELDLALAHFRANPPITSASSPDPKADVALADLCEEYKKNIDSLMDNMRTKEGNYKTQIQKIQREMEENLLIKEEEKHSLLSTKEKEISDLWIQLRNQEKEKQSEMIRQQIEFNAKLASIQSRNCKSYPDTNSLHQNIYRTKLQHLQEEKNKEIESLRNTIKDLERRLSCGSDSRLKRKRF
ncbi:coiled-coil domain-containing protein 152 [Bufo bufo]|uniref:coiled-coil domain-containing protein 152 n=1 Tax=Bufo bufo TaxID=8384 RepID=UPI001ABE182E|nr:coiled-coil domain-containing protein 152 [Bufo bufo]